MKSKKIALMGLLTALAMIFSYIEFLIPISIGIPGIKLGLANIVVVTALYVIKPQEAFLINVVRILLVGLLFGNSMSLIYSLAGGLLSFGVMLLLKKINGFSVYGISIAGGVSHNVGQILAAMLTLENLMIAYYLPALLIAGTVTGLLIGFLSSRIIPQVKKMIQA